MKIRIQLLVALQKKALASLHFHPVVTLPRGMPPSPIRRLLARSLAPILAPRIIDIGPIHFVAW